MSTALKTILDATADALEANPSAAAAEVSAGGELVGTCEVEVRVGDRRVKVDMPEALGGNASAPSPGEYALASLGSCQAITYRIWSEKLGIRLDRLRVDVQDQIDIRGLFGLHDEVRPGFGKVDVHVELSGPEPSDRYEELRRAVNEHCPVLDIFANTVPIGTTLTVA